ncbi:hypothetical protein [Colwellia asteriadis]|uniref:hypothetical protein n=1 Tax=Colwellia asteriadis TaxID=517723 RepID=UPI0031D36E1D
MSNNVKLLYLDGKSAQVQHKQKAISSGADGTIYASVDGKLALKIYHDPTKDMQRQDKLWQMLAHAPTTAGFCWPIAVVSDKKNNFIGYAMPLLDLSSCHTLEMLLSKRLRESLGITESYQFRVTVAINLASKVAELHRLGHHIIDLKPANLSFDQHTGEVVILDCDGFSIQGKNKRFKGHQYTAGYIAPEAFGAKITPEKLGIGQDLFALAAILFQLLNNGLHPFQGVSRNGKLLPSDNQAKITAGLYAYAKKPHAKIKPSPWSIHTDFPEALSQAFTQSLISKLRTKASVWQQLLSAQSLQLKVCQQDANHAYWQKNCPHCQLHQSRAKVQKKTKGNNNTSAKQPSGLNAQQQSANNQTHPRTVNPSSVIMAIIVITLAIITLYSCSGSESVIKQNNSSQSPTNSNADDTAITNDRVKFTYKAAPELTVAHSLSGNVTYKSRGITSRRDSEILAEIPFYQLSAFDSAADFPLIKYSPFGAISPSVSPEVSLKKIDFEMTGSEVAKLAHRTDRLYRLDDWQYDRHNNHAYVYNCKYSPGVCTHVTQMNSGKKVSYKFNDFSAEDRLPGEKVKMSEHSYRPWRFSLTGNGKKIVMMSNFELLVYDVNNSNKPIIKQKLPEKWADWNITRLLTVNNGQRLFISLAKSEKYGINYQGFVVELSLIDGVYQITTDFSRLTGANTMSGVDVATNLAGDILAIGEYVHPEINGTKYEFFSKPIEVALAYPVISLWQKTAQGWQPLQSLENKTLTVTPNQYNPAKVLVEVPSNISDTIMHMAALLTVLSDSKIVSDLGVNRGFMFNQRGNVLLTGIDAKRRGKFTDSKVSIYKLNAARNSLSLTAELEETYTSTNSSQKTLGLKEFTYLSAALSNDGTQVAFGWFVFADAKSDDWKKTLATQQYQLDLFNVNTKPVH